MISSKLKKAFTREQKPILVFLGVFVVIAFFHVWQLDNIPRGIFHDEGVNGFESYALQQTGMDTFKEPWPFYFTALWDYRGPYFMYPAAAVFALVGPSIAALRSVSAMYFLLFLLCTYALLWRLFKSNLVRIYGVIAMGTLPWLFTISRVAFRVNAQIFFVMLALFMVHVTWKAKKHILLHAAVTGTFIGLTVHSYESSKVVMPLMLVGTLVFLWRKGKGAVLTIGAAAVIAALPTIIFGYYHAEDFSNRAKATSYLYDDITQGEKLKLFAKSYADLWSPDYLLLHGDTQLRHSTHFGGQVYWIVAALALLAFLSLFFSPSRRRVKFSEKDPFAFYVLYLVLIGSTAAALTIAEGPHGIRSLQTGAFLALFSCYGLAVLLQIQKDSVRKAVTTLCLCVLVLESGLYLHDYFVSYPARSEVAFDSYPLLYTMRRAEQTDANRIVVSEEGSFGWREHSFRFYAHVWRNKGYTVDRKRLSEFSIEPGEKTCVIYVDTESAPANTEFITRYENYLLSCAS